MKRDKEAKPTGDRHLANRLAIILGIVLIIIFLCLTATVIFLSGRGIKTAIGNEFNAMSKGTGQQVQNVLTSAENSANAVVQYVQEEFQDNQEDTAQDSGHISVIYGVPISEKCFDAEQYIIQSVRQSVKTNTDIVGMGVLFEPNAFVNGLSEYGFYISDQTVDQTLEPYIPYAEFSVQEYYSVPKETKKPHITAPYEDAGYTMVTYSYPIICAGQLRGVITADINVSNFSKTVYENDKYPSMYTTIIDKNSVVIYDSGNLKRVGGELKDFMDDQTALKEIQKGMEGTAAFQVEAVRDGTTEVSFYYPIISEQTKWWAINTLDKADLNASVNQIVLVLTLIEIGALVAAVLLLGFIVRRTLRPIDSVVEAAEKIAKGDLDIQLKARSDDEIGRLVDAFGTTIITMKGIIEDIQRILGALAEGDFHVRSQCPEYYTGDYAPILASMRLIRDNLNATLLQINQSADEVAGGSEQVASGAQALAHGASEQAAALEELAAVINEVSQQVKSTANNAQNVRERTAEAGNEASVCNRQMQEMILAMDEIRESSQEISQIIKTIEDIAFQTNILSLNAAVEAARAGTAGRGFAVVADEVRNLAGKSAQASKNTSELIENSIEAVRKGTKIASDTAQSLQQVVGSTTLVSDTVDKITSAMDEQADSIVQVTQNIEQISNVVQNNSATAEESAAASEELSAQAQMFKELTGHFKLLHTNPGEQGSTEG